MENELNETYLLANEILLDRREMNALMKAHGFFRRKKIEKFAASKAKEMNLNLSNTSIERAVAMVAVRTMEIELA